MTAALGQSRAPRFCPSPEFEARYELGKELGKGGFGTVYECRDRDTGEKLACKVLNREHVRRGQGKEASQEASIMQMLTSLHYGVIQIADMIEDDLHTYIVMELCSGGSLLEVLKANGPLPEESARVVLGQVAAALAFCHSHRVLHLDVKPDNIFFLENATEVLYRRGFCLPPHHSNPAQGLLSQTLSSQGTHGTAPLGVSSSLEIRTRLADFGLATCLKPGKKVRGDVGSSHFKAPEIVAGDRFGLEVDVWSLGVVLCVMLTGAVPFLGASNGDMEGLNKAILSGRINFCTARWWGIPEAAQDLVRRMLQVDPAKRITASDALAHPWLTATEFRATDDLLPTIPCQPVLPTGTGVSAHHGRLSLGPSPRPGHARCQASPVSSGSALPVACTLSRPPVHKQRLRCAPHCPRTAGHPALPWAASCRSSIHVLSVL